MTDACPKDDLLLRFAHGKLSFVDAEAVELHLDGCADCRTLAATAASGEPPLSRAPRRIGRYELRGLLGAGGMGVVHDAWDPQLQRAVAVKILRPGGGGNAAE